MIPLLPLLLAAAAPLAPWTPVPHGDAAKGTAAFSAWAISREDNGRLIVRCDRVGDRVVSIQFIPKTRLSGAGVVPVSLRFDGGSPMIDNWELIGAGAIDRDDTAATTLGVAIAHARTIQLRATGTAGAPVDATFPGPASEAPIRKVVESCGFTFGQVPVRTPPPAAPAPSETPQ